MKQELLRMNHVSLIKNGEVFLDNLNFQMYAGEIMGLLVKEQKGQAQMIDLICRNSAISFGTVWYAGRTVNSYSYSDGSVNRVYRIEEKSHLVEDLSVVDNLFVLRKGFKKYFISEQVLYEQAVRFFAENGIRVDVSKRVRSLSDSERCFVELGKALLLGCRLIVVDNPANFLSRSELTRFQSMLKRLSREGTSILYIGNHHQEVFKIADRACLFASGRIKKIFEKGEMTDQAMAPYITDWRVQNMDLDTEEEDGVLHFHSVFSGSLKGLRFNLHKGECLTLLDVDNGIEKDLLGLLTGGQTCEEGRITLEHEPYTRERAVNYLDEGIGIIPENSVETLLFRDRTYMENLTFLLDRKLKKSVIPRKVYKSIRREYEPLAGKAIHETRIENLSMEELFGLVYYKMQLFHPKILVCIRPLAKGDMFSRLKIVNLLKQILAQGTAVLILTTNVSDTLEISDRLMVVENGTSTASYEKSEFNRIVR